MAPPRFIYHSLSGNRPFAIEADAGETETLSRIDSALLAQDESHSILRDEGRDFFMRRAPNRYGATLLETFSGHSAATIESYLPRLLGEARGGDRRRYLDAMRFSYAVLCGQSIDYAVFHARRIAAISHEYTHYLDSNHDLGPEERLRYLFAASRVAQAALAHVETQGSYSPAIGELRDLLHSMDRHLEEYYRFVSLSGAPTEALQGVIDQVRLREALLEDQPGDAHHFAGELGEFYREHPPLFEDRTWPTETSRLLATDADFPAAMENLSGSSGAEQNAVLLNGMGLQLVVSVAAALDLSDEEEIGTVRERYRQLSAVLSVMILRHPEMTLEELMERVRTPLYGADVVRAVTEASEANAPLSEMLRESRGEWGPVQLVEAARTALEHLQNRREDAGRRIFPMIFEALEQGHSLHHVSEILSQEVELCAHLNFRGAASGAPASSGARALELLRRGPRAEAEIRTYLENHPSPQLHTLLYVMQSRSNEEVLSEFVRHILTASEGLWEGEDHEIASLHGILSLFAQTEEGPGALRLDTATRMRALQSLHRMTGFGFRAERVLRHLTSLPNLVAIGAGVFTAELLPMLMLQQAARNGGALRGLVSGGVLHSRGAALSGIVSGLFMGGLSSLIHNHEREDLGFHTHYLRDFGLHSALNMLTFGLTLPFSHWLNRRLTPSDFASRGVGSLSLERALLFRGGSALFGGFIGWGSCVGLRYLQTGEITSSWDEAAENFGGLLLFEGASGYVRGQITALFPNRGGRYESLYRIVGEHRLRGLRELSDRIVSLNPRLEPQRAWVLRQLFLAEFRSPTEVDRVRSRLDRGDYPTRYEVPRLLDIPHLSLRLLPRETLPELAAPRPTAPEPRIRMSRSPRRSPLLLGAGATPVDAARPETIAAPAHDHFVLRYQSEDGETASAHSLSLSHIEADSVVLGRGDFSFLSRALRQHLSREHFRLQRRGDHWEISDLSRNGTWVEEWTRIDEPSGSREELTWTPLSADRPVSLRPGQRIALGRIRLPRSSSRRRSGDSEHDNYYFNHHVESGEETRQPILANFADLSGALVLQLELPGVNSSRGGRPPMEPTRRSDPPPPMAESSDSNESHPPLRIALEPGRSQRLDGARLIRDRETSLYRLIGDGGLRIDLLREFGEAGERGEIQNFSGSDNPLIGEIGEGVWVRLTRPDGSSTDHNLFLDTPEGSGGRLPQVTMRLDGREKNLRFRATDPELNIGRLLDTQFFESGYISRNHFSIRVGSFMGHPRYFLTVHSQNGMMIEGLYFRRGQTPPPLTAGAYDLGFLMQRERTDAVVGSLRLELPPIEVNFPEWRMGELLPNHDRAIPPTDSPFASPPEAPPPAIEPTNRNSLRVNFSEFIRKLFD